MDRCKGSVAHSGRLPLHRNLSITHMKRKRKANRPVVIENDQVVSL